MISVSDQVSEGVSVFRFADLSVADSLRLFTATGEEGSISVGYVGKERYGAAAAEWARW